LNKISMGISFFRKKWFSPFERRFPYLLLWNFSDGTGWKILRGAWNLRGRRDTKIQVIEMSVSSLYYLFSVSSLISKIWLLARSGINKFQFSKAVDLLSKIVEYRASLLWMFNVYEFCCFNSLRKTCTVFLFNEAVLKFAKLPCLSLRIKGKM
jgi:hypothetical protein